MSEIKQFMDKCCVCGEEKLCSCARVTPVAQGGNQPLRFVVAPLSPKQIEQRIARGESNGDECCICDACAEKDGKPPKGLWTTWIVAWVLTAVGLAINAACGRAISGPGMALTSVGVWVLLFTTLFLVIKAGLGGKGIALAFAAAFVPFIGLIALPLLRKRINHNEQVVTALKKWADEPSAPRQASGLSANRPSPIPQDIEHFRQSLERSLEILNESDPAASAAPRVFAPYTGSGVCDVCNQPLSGRQAWIVPNDVFYRSAQYKLWHRGAMARMGMSAAQADAPLLQLQMMDHSAGSAVCQNCIHMFR